MSQIQNSVGSNVIMTPLCVTMKFWVTLQGFPPVMTVVPLLPVLAMPSACYIWDHLITPNSLITLLRTL